jgi:hypothetical protein
MKTPAEIVIERFGGVRPLARLLKVAHTSVARWPLPKIKRGSGGLVPSQYHRRLLDLAADRGVKLSTTELIYGSVSNV